MKPYTYALLAAAAACGLAAAETAYTTPVGYTTKALPANQFTLVGLTVHNSTVAAGVIDAESASPKSVTDNETNFSTLLTAGATYVLELADGTVQEVSSWSGSVLTTPDDITANVTPGTTTYKLRKAATITDIFGAANTLNLTPSPDGDPASADKILIPNASNSFDTVFYFDDGQGTEGWLDSEGNLAADKVIAYPDGFYVQRVAGSSINLVVSGEVKLDPTDGALVGGFNYLNGVAPAGLTLATSGIQGFISQSSDGDPSTVDNVLLQNPNGTYTTCFYFNDGQGTEGWLDSEGNLAGEYSLDGGFLIFNRAGVKPYSVNVPSNYSNL